MLTPDGRLAVVTNRLSGNITVIDTVTRAAWLGWLLELIRKAWLSARNSTKAYVTNAASTSVVDLGSFSVIATIANTDIWHVCRRGDDGHE